MKAMSRPQIYLCLISIGLLCVSLFGPSASTVVASTDRSSQNNQDVQVLFEKHCASCHGKDGRAKTFKAKFNSARNLTDPKWQDSVTDERIFNSIANGRGKMPSFHKKLSDADIDKLAAYVRTLKK
jgi:mono/diheme cytochrome c family protein